MANHTDDDAQTDWRVIDFDEVLRYFAKGFDAPEGRRIVVVDSYVDLGKNKALFAILSVKQVPDDDGK